MRPRICAVITGNDAEAVRAVEPIVDLFEVRIDLIGEGWQQLAKQLGKPWIACNRVTGEGGSWRGSESGRIQELLRALGAGADTIDIELGTKGLAEVVSSVKKSAKCLISSHDPAGTPPLGKMREIVHRQIEAGADICKVVTTARTFADNLAALQLIKDFPETSVVSFTMGPLGQVSRVLCPLVGGAFAYVSIAEGKESASGQMTAGDLRNIYGMLRDE